MSYNWTSGELITAEKLNSTSGVLLVNIEISNELVTPSGGSGELADIPYYPGTSSHTFAEVKTAYNSGSLIVFRFNVPGEIFTYDQIPRYLAAQDVFVIDNHLLFSSDGVRLYAEGEQGTQT